MIPIIFIAVAAVVGLGIAYLTTAKSGWKHKCKPPKATQRRLGGMWQCRCARVWAYKEHHAVKNGFYYEEVR